MLYGVTNMDLIPDKRKLKIRKRKHVVVINVKYILRGVICVFNVDSGTKPCFVY